MHHFAYRDGALFAEEVDLRRIAAEVGTPVYVYSSATIERHYRLFESAMRGIDPTAPAPHVFYAVKANGNLGVLKALAALGAGADTVSEGEVRKALAAGFAPEKIVFSGGSACSSVQRLLRYRSSGTRRSRSDAVATMIKSACSRSAPAS